MLKCVRFTMSLEDFWKSCCHCCQTFSLVYKSWESKLWLIFCFLFQKCQIRITLQLEEGPQIQLGAASLNKMSALHKFGESETPSFCLIISWADWARCFESSRNLSHIRDLTHFSEDVMWKMKKISFNNLITFGQL